MRLDFIIGKKVLEIQKSKDKSTMAINHAGGTLWLKAGEGNQVYANGAWLYGFVEKTVTDAELFSVGFHDIITITCDGNTCCLFVMQGGNPETIGTLGYISELKGQEGS